MDTIKVVAATLTVVGIVLGFFEKWFSPHTRVLQSSPSYPEFLKWLGWVVTSGGAALYIVRDWLTRK